MYATIKKIVLFSLGIDTMGWKKIWVGIFIHFVFSRDMHIHADKRIWDKSIISSIKPKFEDGFFVNLRVVKELQTWNYYVRSANQNNFTFTICTRLANHQ